jgi:hypothetical protein
MVPGKGFCAAARDALEPLGKAVVGKYEAVSI